MLEKALGVGALTAAVGVGIWAGTIQTEVNYLKEKLVEGVDVDVVASKLASSYADKVRGPKGEPGEKGERGEPGPSGVAPIGTVVASEVRCQELGSEWTLYEQAGGRFIVGHGSATDSRQETRRFSSGDSGGAYQHPLGNAEMPSHRHQLQQNSQRQATATPSEQGWATTHDVHDVVRQSSSEGEPHNNMPPYIALYICKKNR